MHIKFLLFMVIMLSTEAEEYTLSKGNQTFYESGVEQDRLKKGTGPLEKRRTEILLDQFLPPPPAIILDVGGGTGIYAFALAKKGYTVYLIDPVASHIEEAKKIAKTATGKLPSGYILGDARKIEMADSTADVVLFFGPLYHCNPNDRKIALTEAFRVLKKDGTLFAVGVSRYAPLISYFKKGILTEELKTAFFNSITKGYFEYKGATFYTHFPPELQKELETAGFSNIILRPVEGLGSLVPNQQITDETIFLDFVRIVEVTEEDPSTLGTSGHIMAIGKKK